MLLFDVIQHAMHVDAWFIYLYDLIINNTYSA